MRRFPPRWSLVLVPFAFLAGFELLLRGLGVAAAPRFFASHQDPGEAAVWKVPSSRSPWGPLENVLPGLRFQMPKPSGVTRIFCVGASTVRGFPFDPLVSFPLRMKLRLERMFPARAFEVLICAGNGRNAASLVPLVEELVEYDADAILVYSGHNELHSWNQPALRRPLARKVRGLLGSTALGRLLRDLLPGEGEYAREVAGEELSLSAEAAAPVDGVPVDGARAAAGDAVVTDRDPLEGGMRQEAFELYRRSMAAMARAALRHRVPVFFCEPVSNLLDFAPTTTLLDASTPAGGVARTALDGVLARMNAERPGGSGRLPVLELDPGAYPAASLRALRADLQTGVAAAPDAALLHFLLGRVLAALGEFDRAREELKRARDLDALPLRAPADLVAAARDAVVREGAIWIPLQESLEALANHGLPGEDLFVDNVHPTFRGQEFLAHAALEALRAADIPAPRADWPAEIDTAPLESIEGLRGRLAEKIARLGLLCITHGARGGTQLRWAWRRSFVMARELDPACAAAQLGESLVALAYDLDPAAPGRIQALLEAQPEWFGTIAALARAHQDWRELLAPLRKPR